MSEDYIRNHFDDIKKYACVIENRLYDDCTVEGVLRDNAQVKKLADEQGLDYILIDGEYKVDIDL
ncbi:MAG: hypothetical protein IIW48_13170 [Clostridia bacterium]|nr:hypothetical protein [Clostridia bacterium]